MPRQRPPLAGLDGRPILVHLVVNVEHWPFDQPMPRTILTPPHGIGNVPDVQFQLGRIRPALRPARMIDAIAGRGLPASASLNASVIDAYPGRRRAAAGRLGIHRPRHPPARAVAGRRRRGPRPSPPRWTGSSASAARARAAGSRPACVKPANARPAGAGWRGLCVRLVPGRPAQLDARRPAPAAGPALCAGAERFGDPCRGKARHRRVRPPAG